jgi:dTDP-4-dehydrorhamnose reductase
LQFSPLERFDVETWCSATILAMSENPPRKVLITGVHGQLGRALAAACQSRGCDFAGRDIDTLDIIDPAAVDRWIGEAQPGAVINCAAYTAVDDCETDETAALAVNGTAVGHLAAACNRVGAQLVQISTDYVFSGDGHRPYREDHPVAPINAYGRTKARGEELAQTAQHHLVLRTAWLYGRGGRNFVETIRSQIDSGARTIRVVADQRGCPTYCDDLATVILDLVGSCASGVIHAANSGETTWHGFAEAIAEILGAQLDIVPVTTAEFPRPAPRPPYSVLDTTRLAAVLDRPMPHWKDALSRYLGAPCAC